MTSADAVLAFRKIKKRGLLDIFLDCFYTVHGLVLILSTHDKSTCDKVRFLRCPYCTSTSKPFMRLPYKDSAKISTTGLNCTFIIEGFCAEGQSI